MGVGRRRAGQCDERGEPFPHVGMGGEEGRWPDLILGACHPPSAHRALTAAPEVGVLLPCNVTVSVEGGKTVVRAMDPAPVMGLVGKAELAAVGAEVGAALKRVVAACGG